MTDIRMRMRRQGTTGPVRLVGSSHWVPTRALNASAGLILPASMTVNHTGTADVTLRNVEPCTAEDGWCWVVRTWVDGVPVDTRAVLVPDRATVVYYEDLERVDPYTLDPTNISMDVWNALRASVITARDEATAAAALVPDGAQNAGDDKMVFTRGGVPVLDPITLVPGPRGLPGANAVPTDEAVATYLETGGTHTRTAADSRYLRFVTGHSDTPPPVDAGAIWIDETGVMHRGVDLGPDPIVNLATNPNFARSPGGFGTVPVEGRAAFRVGTQNILYLHLDTPANWATRKQALADIIMDSGCDILGLQEVSTWEGHPTQADDLLGALPPGWGLVQVLEYGVAFLYKTATFALEDDPVLVPINEEIIDDMAERSLMYATFTHYPTEQRVIMATVHMKSGSVPMREENSHIVGAALKRVYQQTGHPVILVGDMNDSTTTNERRPRVVLPTYGLIEARGIAATTINDALNSFNGLDPDMVDRQEGAQIDQIYVTEEFTVTTQGVYVDYANGTSLPLRTPIPSDHNMVIADINVAKRRGVRRWGTNDLQEVVTLSLGASQFWTQCPVCGRTGLGIDPSGATGVNTAIYPAPRSGPMSALGWEPGGTYTVAADICIERPQTGATLSEYARGFTIGTFIGSTTIEPLAQSTQAPNERGTTRVTATATFPPDATGGFLRLFNGSRTMGDLVYWHAAMNVEGEYAGPPFSGDDPGTQWVRTPNTSPSIYEGPSWVPISKQDT